MSVRGLDRWIEICLLPLVALAMSCRDRTEIREPPPETVRFTRIEGLVAYAGCEQIWLESRPRCLFVPGSPLHLWLEQPEGSPVTTTVDGHLLDTTRHTVPGLDGFRLDVTLEEGAHELVVELPRTHKSWSLPLRAWSDDARPPAEIETNEVVDQVLVHALGLSTSGRSGEALAKLEEIERKASLYPKGTADLATYRGIAYWHQGRHHDAAAELAKGTSFAVRLHDPGLIEDAIHMYAGVAAELGYWDAAVEWGERVLTFADEEAGLVECGPLARIMSTVGYAHLLRSRYQDEPTTRARALLEQALSRVGPGAKCSDPQSVPPIVLSLADEALARGEPNEALEVLRTIEIDAAHTADQRLRLYDAKLRALDGAGQPLAEQTLVLDLLEREVLEAKLPEGRWRLALRRGDLLRSNGRIEDAVSAYRDAEREALAIAELAAVGVGRESAVALHAQSTERLVGLLVGEARPEEALCAAREAQARRIQGVEGALASHEPRETNDHTIDLAIDRYRRARAALDTALASEKALLPKERMALNIEVESKERALVEVVNEILRKRSSWRPSCSELVPRRPGELLLGLYPGRRRWFIFVQDDKGTEVRVLDDGPTHALSDASLLSELLGPMSDRLANAQRVRVLSSGRAQELDVHLMSWRGAPLLEHAPVAYGAELPRSNRVRSSDNAHCALLIADPTETLPKAAEEVRAAARWMTSQGWTLDILAPNEADRAHVVNALSRSSFFYFAGHGVHTIGPSPDRRFPPYAGGSQGWPAYLRLKSGSKLEIHNVLMLPSAPAHVALLGCETGVPGSAGGGMSLALAFLVAGAEQVVATPVETTDEVSYATGVGLLSGMSGTGVDLAAGLREAQRKLLRDGAKVGRYRVWVR
ncbi:MAG: hypothetical protein AB1Z98_22035 [Nannocystaceae bacterium]